MALFLFPFVLSYITLLLSKNIYFNQKYIFKQLIKGLTGGILISLICFKVLSEIFLQTNIFISTFFTLLGVLASVYFDGNKKRASSMALFTSFSLGIFSCFVLIPLRTDSMFYNFIPFFAMLNFGMALKESENLFGSKIGLFAISFLFTAGFFICSKGTKAFHAFNYIIALFTGSVLYNACADAVFENSFDVTSVFALFGFIFQTILLCYF